MINGMNILHSINNNSFQYFNILKTTYQTDSTTLDQNIALSQ